MKWFTFPLCLKLFVYFVFVFVWRLCCFIVLILASTIFRTKPVQSTHERSHWKSSEYKSCLVSPSWRRRWNCKYVYKVRTWEKVQGVNGPSPSFRATRVHSIVRFPHLPGFGFKHLVLCSHRSSRRVAPQRKLPHLTFSAKSHQRNVVLKVLKMIF